MQLLLLSTPCSAALIACRCCNDAAVEQCGGLEGDHGNEAMWWLRVHATANCELAV